MSTTNGNPQKSTNTASSEDEDKQARIALQRIITMSLLAGLCPAIPIPFLDDMALRFIRKRALRSEFERQGLRPGRAQLDVFLQERSRLLGCLSSILIYPIKKLFRKVSFVLAVKDCVDAASWTFHTLWMVRHAMVKGLFSNADLGVEVDALRGLRLAVDAASQQVDTRPFHQMWKRALGASRAWIRQGGRALGKMIRFKGGRSTAPETVERAVQDVEPLDIGEVDEVANRLGEQMWAERGYLRAVERAFETHWAR
ncbi:MAG TPA: hypothetical protein PLV85_25660, partial [Polyangiaceae bacterium]|nr:hypothetical protein [Polyangiaceae bacterium]